MKRLFSSFALTVLLTLGASGIAHAQTTPYSSCASVPTSLPAGDIVITDTTGSCDLTADTLTTTAGVGSSYGKLSITADGDITTMNITVASHMQIQTTSGSIMINGDIAPTTPGSTGGNVLLVATTTVGVNNITGGLGGNVDIQANGTAFIIGGSGNTNGVQTITAYGANNGQVMGSVGVYIHNASGGITVNDLTAINTAAIKRQFFCKFGVASLVA